MGVVCGADGCARVWCVVLMGVRAWCCVGLMGARVWIKGTEDWRCEPFTGDCQNVITRNGTEKELVELLRQKADHVGHAAVVISAQPTANAWGPPLCACVARVARIEDGWING